MKNSSISVNNGSFSSENRGSQKHSQEIASPLKGKELLKYIERNRKNVSNNGDQLCIGAGYGEISDDGSANCRLDLFSTELIRAKKEQNLATINNNASKEILESYTSEQLKLIAELGCISGKANKHLQLEEAEKFYDENQQEIKETLSTQFGEDYLEESKKRVGGENEHWKHRAVWRFIEIIAQERINQIKFI